MGLLARFWKRRSGLAADPIPRDRMDLLWLNPDEFKLLATALRTGTPVVIGPEKGGPRTLRLTEESLAWLRTVDDVARRASEAESRGDHVAAIKFYRQALELAPGADIYLMSIGSCYGNMGEPQQALPYLERAHEISPGNKRIEKNLRALQTLLRSDGRTA